MFLNMENFSRTTAFSSFLVLPTQELCVMALIWGSCQYGWHCPGALWLEVMVANCHLAGKRDMKSTGWISWSSLMSTPSALHSSKYLHCERTGPFSHNTARKRTNATLYSAGYLVFLEPSVGFAAGKLGSLWTRGRKNGIWIQDNLIFSWVLIK